MTPSWRATYWVDIEVTAPDRETAVNVAREVLLEGNYDSEQAGLNELFEVDPLTGREI